MCWATRTQTDQFELLIVTSWVDEVGSKAIYDLLFEAYDASATPKEIDPFIVNVFSPKSYLGDQLLRMIGSSKQKAVEVGIQDERGFMYVLGDHGDFIAFAALTYVFHPRKKRTAVEDLRRFRRFQRNVQALAA